MTCPHAFGVSCQVCDDRSASLERRDKAMIAADKTAGRESLAWRRAYFASLSTIQTRLDTCVKA